jgi:hypothetical protein
MGGNPNRKMGSTVFLPLHDTVLQGATPERQSLGMQPRKSNIDVPPLRVALAIENILAKAMPEQIPYLVYPYIGDTVSRPQRCKICHGSRETCHEKLDTWRT